MTDVLLHLIEFSLPAGFLGSIAAWMLSRKVREAKNKKEASDTYRQMYEKESKMLLDIHDTYIKLYDAFIKVEKIIAKAIACPYYYSSNCPVRIELCKQKRDNKLYPGRKRNAAGQREYKDGEPHEADPGPGVESVSDAVI